MKNLLFVSSEPPFKLFTGGDTQAEIILNFLKKKFKVTIVFWKHNNNKNKIKIIKKKISEFDSIIIEKKKTNKFIRLAKIFLQFNSYNYNPYNCEIDNKTLNLIEKKFDYCFIVGVIEIIDDIDLIKFFKNSAIKMINLFFTIIP